MKTALFVALIAGLAGGWRLHVWYGLAQAKRAIKRMCATDRVVRQREAVARQERAQVWPIQASSPDEAIRLFHRRVGLPTSGLWP